MNRLFRRWLPATLTATSILVPATSHAIPAWEHKTGTPCNACHFGATNRLTKMGWEFMSRGHRLTGDQGITTDNIQDVNFLHYASLAARGSFNARKGYSTPTAAGSAPSTNFSTDALSLYTGGPLMKKLSFYATYDFYTGGGFTNPAGASTTTYRNQLSEGYVQYTNDLQSKSFWWARAGQFPAHILWVGAISAGGFSAAASRTPGAGNPFSPTSNHRGASAGFDTEHGTQGEIGIVNGGTNPSSDARTDTNNYKDQYFTLGQSLDEYNSMVGLYVYNGQYLNPATGSGATLVPAWTDKYTRTGLMGQFMRDTYAVHGAYFTGKNEIRTGGTRHPYVYYIEADYNVKPNDTVYVRYDKADDKVGGVLPLPTVTGARNMLLGYSFRYGDLSRFGITLSDSKSKGTAGVHTKTLGLSWGLYL